MNKDYSLVLSLSFPSPINSLNLAHLARIAQNNTLNSFIKLTDNGINTDFIHAHFYALNEVFIEDEQPHQGTYYYININDILHNLTTPNEYCTSLGSQQTPQELLEIFLKQPAEQKQAFLKEKNAITLKPKFSGNATQLSMTNSQFCGGKNRQELIGAELQYLNKSIQIPLMKSSITQPNVIYTGELDKEEIERSIISGSFFNNLKKLDTNFKLKENGNISVGTVFASWDWLCDRLLTYVKIIDNSHSCEGDARVALSILYSYGVYKV